MASLVGVSYWSRNWFMPALTAPAAPWGRSV